MASLLPLIDTGRLPRHIAIIMDGNGRWAQQRGLPRIFGHKEGAAAVRRVTEACSDVGVKVLTLYAFSTENWVRPSDEISGLMGILKHFLRSEVALMMSHNVRLQIIGDPTRFSPTVRREMDAAMAATAKNTGLVLNLALNYGGRHEIVRAVNKALDAGARQIDEATLAANLDTAGLPDPDLFIRTSGEMRISNFLLWQLAYTELYVTQDFWPDFDAEHLYAAILNYQQRDRRFGGVGMAPQDTPAKE